MMRGIGVTSVEIEGQREKQSAEHVLGPRRPRRLLENRSGWTAKTAAVIAVVQRAPSHPSHCQKQYDPRKPVHQRAGQMMPGWLHSKELAVQHVREPSEQLQLEAWNPVARAATAKGQSLLYVPIVVNVFIIIDVDELVTASLDEDDRHRKQEQAANYQDTSRTILFSWRN